MILLQPQVVLHSLPGENIQQERYFTNTARGLIFYMCSKKKNSHNTSSIGN